MVPVMYDVSVVTDNPLILIGVLIMAENTANLQH